MENQGNKAERESIWSLMLVTLKETAKQAADMASRAEELGERILGPRPHGDKGNSPSSEKASGFQSSSADLVRSIRENLEIVRQVLTDLR